MESVKIASGIGGHGPHGPQILYSGSRQPPPGHPSGAQVVHPPTTRSHEGSPYKGTISPPMVSRGAHYAPYASVVDGGHSGTNARYLPQSPYLTYQRDSYARPIPDRPVLLPQPPKRPSIMGSYSGYTRGEIMPILSASTIPMGPSVDSSCKRIKLSQSSKTDVRAPLVIETESNSRESSYCPQVEALSPTLPPDPRDESPLQSSQSFLVKQLDQMEKDISMTEASLKSLEKKKNELEAAAAAAQKGDQTSQPEAEEAKEVKHQSTAQIIYAENRKIAEEGHNSLAKLIPPSEIPRVLPLYHQPSDAEVYQQNKAKYSTFKQRLLEYFKRKQELKYSREQQISQTYTKLMNEWVKRVDKIENSKKHTERVGKNRELFEKVFPELRKQREDKERFSRVGARVKSDAEMEEIIDGIQDQENEDKKMRAYAVIPPILLDEKRRTFRYINNNSLVKDPIGEYKEAKNVNIWTEHESEIFKDKYLQHPKNFVLTASYLERKSVADCIQHYYLTKRKENYKLLVKRRIRRPRKGNNQAPVDAMVLNSASGVTTRGSAAAQKGLLKNGSGNGGIASLVQSVTTSNASTSGDEAPSINLTSHAPSMNWTSSQAVSISNDVCMTPVVNAACGEEAVTSESFSPAADAVAISAAVSVAASSPRVSITPNNVDSSVMTNCQEVHEKDKENLAGIGDKIRRREQSKSDDSSDDNSAEHGRGGPHDCVLCKTRLEHYGQSRPVSASQASQYGLSESTLPLNSRVCSNCRCRSVKRRVPQCLIPSCTTSKWRVKRLRPFPSRWNHLPASVKEPIIKELKIPNDLTKSCSACHNRIVRKLGADAEEPPDTSRWSEEDISNLRSALREVGCHWLKVTERVKNKTQSECKSFYLSLKGKYQLDEALSEYRQSKGKPSVTDEEESGSSTSSCEEPGSLPPPDHRPPPQIRHDSASDTASASSPPPTSNNIDERKEGNRDSIIKQPHPPTAIVPVTTREDNDSSATASADEGQNGADRESPPEVQHIPHPGERRAPSQSLLSGKSNSRAMTASQQPNSNLQNIINNTVENAIKSGTNGNGYSESKTNTNDHITINSLLDDSYKRGSTRGVPGTTGWAYAQGSPHQMIDTSRTVPEREATPTSYEVDICESGLDLTVRKRSPPPAPSSHPIVTHLQPSQGPPRDIPTMTIRGGAEVIATGKGSPPRAHSNSISYSQTPHSEHNRYIQDYRKSPSNFSGSNLAPPPQHTIANIVPRIPSPHLVYGSQPPRPPVALPKTTKSIMAPPPSINVNSPRVTHSHIPSLATNASGGRIPVKPEKGQMTIHPGSITHGTPVNQHTLVSVALTQANRYDMIAKPIMPREGGSITQGTPVHHDNKRGAPPHQNPPTVAIKDGMIMENRSGVEIIPRSCPPVSYEREAQYRPTRPSISTPSSYPYTTHTYTRAPYSDPQISSRQILETDYITSQQMAPRRGVTCEKDIRVSPRGREHGIPQPSARDHRSYPSPPVTSIDRRVLDQHSRALDSREHRVDQRSSDPSLEFRPIDIRTVSESDKLRKVPVQFLRPAHGYGPIHNQSGYLNAPDVRVSRPSASPASVRDATPTPPTSETMSTHDFRSPGGSTPTPPPPHRLSSVIQRQPSSKPHLGPSKSSSPRPETDRYSPQTRHLTVIPGMGGEALNIAEILHRQGTYANMDLRRDGRQGLPPPHHPVPPHERHQLEGIGKQMVESLQNSRYISDTSQSSEREKEIHTVEIRPHIDDRRQYERMDHSRARVKEDYRNMPSKVIKEADESDSSKLILAYPMDRNKTSPSPKRGGGDYTAANLIEAVITSSMSNYLKKDKEVVTVEDVSELQAQQRLQQSHKEANLHASIQHHPIYSKGSQVHVEAVIPRDFASSDLKKLPPNAHPYRPPLEITRTDGRTVPHVNIYEQSKMRSPAVNQSHLPEKDNPKEFHDSRAPPAPSHRIPPATSAQDVHIHPGSHLGTDERQIIRMPQPQLQQRYAGNENAYKIITDRLQHIFREGTPDNASGGDRRMHESSGARLSRSGTPLSHQQQCLQQAAQQGPPQQRTNAHYDDEHVKKRPRLEVPDGPQQRPPSRPRSTGTGPSIPVGVGLSGDGKEEVADSPQSGEMVIDESPRDGKLHLGDAGSQQPQDKGISRVSVSQYSSSYTGYRGSSSQPPHTGSWSMNTQPPNSGSRARPQGYEPNVEPVSDDE